MDDRLEKQYQEFLLDCKQASEYCEEQGWPSTGSNYELMVEDIMRQYPELFGED